jgi:metal-sulfur cluster biosynthetic enzyme
MERGMNGPTLQAVEESLSAITDPCSATAGTPMSIVDLGLLNGIEISDGVVHVQIRLTTPGCYFGALFVSEAEQLIKAIPGVIDVHVEMLHDFIWSEDHIRPQAKQRLLARRQAARRASAQL